MIEQTLGHYRILEEIGRGGMGVVYRALDERLERDVALKVLPAGTLADDAARRRFRKEALALSKVSHPNIAVVHDFDTQGAVDFLVMEYVAGTPLAEKLAPGGLPEREVLRLGIQLTDGLEAAHAAGVVHRDLKPGNLRLTPDGRLKILDFGLAKRYRPLTDSEPTESMSGAWGPVGTLPYVAPELLRGEEADPRSDLYSAGVVLYEMTTGRRPHRETDPSALRRAILHEAPSPPSHSNRRVGTGLESLILKALDKDPERRYQSARELRVDLERLSTPGTGVPPPSRRALPRRRWTAAAGIAAAIALAAWWILSRNGVSPGAESPTVTPLVSWPGEKLDSRISPDREWVSFVSNRTGRHSLWLRRTSGGEPQQVLTEPRDIISHVWSPDGARIAVLIYAGEGVLLKIVPAFGGPPERSFTLKKPFGEGNLARWIHSGIYLSVRASGLWRLGAADGSLRLILPKDSPLGARMDFDVCPDEKRVLFTVRREARMALWSSGLEGDRPERMTPDESSSFVARWLGPDCRQIVYSSNRGGQTDLWRMWVGSRSRTRITFSSDAEVQDASADETILTYRENRDRANLWMLDPRTGDARKSQLTSGPLQDSWASFSADGRRLAFQRSRPAVGLGWGLFGSHIFLADLESSDLKNERLVVNEGGDARLSPDGEWLAYVKGYPPKVFELWLNDLRSDHDRRVTEHFNRPWFYPFPVDWLDINFAWSADSASLFFLTAPEGGPQEVRRLRPSSGETDSEVIVADRQATALRDLQVSPSGRRLAYVRILGKEETASELRGRDLVTGEDRILYTPERARSLELFSRGWLEDDDSVIVLEATTNPDWTQRAAILRIRLSGPPERLGVVDGVFAGTARVDAKNGTLYFVKSDEEPPAHNLYQFRLAGAALRRLTDNKIPGVSFAGLEVLSDGTLAFSQQERSENIWLMRFHR
jgi:serine/threonine protein kinase